MLACVTEQPAKKTQQNKPAHSGKPVMCGGATVRQFVDLAARVTYRSVSGVTSAASHSFIRVWWGQEQNSCLQEPAGNAERLISLHCLQLPKKCQCFPEREGIRMVMSKLFSSLCQSCSFRILNCCTGSKQGGGVLLFLGTITVLEKQWQSIGMGLFRILPCSCRPALQFQRRQTTMPTLCKD